MHVANHKAGIVKKGVKKAMKKRRSIQLAKDFQAYTTSAKTPTAVAEENKASKKKLVERGI